MRSIFELITYTLQLSTENTGLVISDGANIMIFFFNAKQFPPSRERDGGNLLRILLLRRIFCKISISEVNAHKPEKQGQ